MPYPEMRNAQVRMKTPASDRKARVATGVPPMRRSWPVSSYGHALLGECRAPLLIRLSTDGASS